MLFIKLLFVAASLITQAYIFDDPAAAPAGYGSAAGPDTAHGNSYVTQADRADPAADRSPYETDSTPTGASCALR